MSKVIAFPGPRRAAFPTCGALALDPAYIEEFPQEELTPRHDVEVIAFPGAWQENQPEESRKTKTRLGVAPKFSEIFSTTCDIPPLFYFVELPLVDARFDWDIRAGPNYILAELNAANQVVATYVPTRTQDDVIVKQNLTLNKTAIYSDFNANLPTKTVRDEFGNVIETLESPEPYGAMQSPSDIDHTRFQGKMLDPVTGFYYFRNRWYDPQARRFVSQDPTPVDEFQPDKIHRYAAFGLNPISNVDPMGTDHISQAKYNQIRAEASSDVWANLAFQNVWDLTRELFALQGELSVIPTSDPKCTPWKNWIVAKQTELRAHEDWWYIWWKWGRMWGWPAQHHRTADPEYIGLLNFEWVDEHEKCLPTFGEQFMESADDFALNWAMSMGTGGLSVSGRLGSMKLREIKGGGGIAIPKNIRLGQVVTLAGKAGRGFSSFDAFKRVYGGRSGYQWHHLILQKPQNITAFGPQAIHSTRNLVNISTPLHNQISGFFNQIREEITGSTTLRIHQWIVNKPLEFQLKFGQEVLQKVRAGIWP